MIDINSLPKPTVVKELDFEVILAENLSYFKNILPDWQPLESDEFLIILQAFAYREIFLRNEINKASQAFFLSTSTQADLDNLASIYNLERLQGSFPYAEYEFELNQIFNQDMIIPKNLTLIDENNNHTAILKENVVIKAGNTKNVGVVELQDAIVSIDVKTEIISTPLPYLIKAKALSIFQNGSTIESDESFKKRILLSLADKSTAGSEETYESYSFRADERILDIKVLNGGAGVVNVYYYSKQADELMQERIVQSLNQKDIRPITDRVVVQQAEIVNFNITADLKIYENQETTIIYSNALTSLENGLNALLKIGVRITISEINDFLRVAGVKEVTILNPTTNIEIQQHQIGVCSAKNITYTII